jgi:SMI1 / KNR4 family (SUKH-1)
LKEVNVKIDNPQPPVQDVDLKKIEFRLGYPLPPEYRNFILQHNGGRPVPHRFSTKDGKIESGVKTFFPVADAGDNLLSEIDDITLTGTIPRNLFPIAIDPIENRLLLSGAGDDAGSVYYWSWDEEPDDATCSYRYMRKIADDFDDFLANLHA